LQFRCGNRVWKWEKEIDINAQPLTSCISNGGGCNVFKRTTSHQVHRILTGKCPVFRHYSYTQNVGAYFENNDTNFKYRSENYETLFFSFNHDYARLSITCRDS